VNVLRVDDGDVIWEPAPDARSTSRIGAYMDWLASTKGLSFTNYQELWQWSVDDLDGFWGSVWEYFELHSDTPFTAVLASREMPGASWFPGATVNYSGELFRRWADQSPSEVAIVGVSQTRPTVEYTIGDLGDAVGRIRVGLQRLGVSAGDRVVAYMPNIPETAAAFIACASLGAIWASAAPEFGPQAVIDRFGQLEPVVLLTIDGYRYGDKDIDISERVATVRAAIPTIVHTVALSYNGRVLPDAVDWATFTAERAELEAVAVPFDHPLCVLFSSGTTGLPKAIVHGHGGIVIETLKNHVFSWDLGPGDRLMWFSTTAWMMWNALVSTLLTGASIVCIDGNPMYPDLTAQWRIAEATRPTMMGLGPAFIMSCAKQGLTPSAEFDLSSIRSFAAAGSPLPTEGFVWLDEQFGDQAPLNIGSGGTDLCTGIVQGAPILPVYAGEMSAKCLGVAAYAFDANGESVIGELGELVITKPMPTMPVKFWGDDDNMTRYRATYYEQYPGVMRFGDWVKFTERGSSIITGRSDATLNRSGVRIGTAEIYRIVEQHGTVNDSLVVHVEDPDGGVGELVLFVALAEGRPLDEGLRNELAVAIRSALSPRHVPDTMVAVRGVPRNLTGKKLELPVKKILQGADPASVVSLEAMADSSTLDDYIAFAASRR
jgi:acetoacetyl-CoA synthetase